MTDWLSSVACVPAEFLKTAGTLLGGVFLALGTYVLARIKESRAPAQTPSGGPRIALDPAEGDFGYTLVPTGTDLTRALHDHGEILRRISGRDDDGDGEPRQPRPPRSQT